MSLGYSAIVIELSDTSFLNLTVNNKTNVNPTVTKPSDPTHSIILTVTVTLNQHASFGTAFTCNSIFYSSKQFDCEGKQKKNKNNLIVIRSM